MAGRGDEPASTLGRAVVDDHLSKGGLAGAWATDHCGQAGTTDGLPYRLARHEMDIGGDIGWREVRHFRAPFSPTTLASSLMALLGSGTASERLHSSIAGDRGMRRLRVGGRDNVG